MRKDSAQIFLTQLCCSNCSLRPRRWCLSHLDEERLSCDKVVGTLRQGRPWRSLTSRSWIEALCCSASQAPKESPRKLGKKGGERNGFVALQRGKSPDSQNFDRHPSDFMFRDASPCDDSRRSWKSDIPAMGFQVGGARSGRMYIKRRPPHRQPPSPFQPQRDPRVPADSSSLLSKYGRAIMINLFVTTTHEQGATTCNNAFTRCTTLY